MKKGKDNLARIEHNILRRFRIPNQKGGSEIDPSTHYHRLTDLYVLRTLSSWDLFELRQVKASLRPLYKSEELISSFFSNTNSPDYEFELCYEAYF